MLAPLPPPTHTPGADDDDDDEAEYAWLPLDCIKPFRPDEPPPHADGSLATQDPSLQVGGQVATMCTLTRILMLPCTPIKHDVFHPQFPTYFT